MRLEPLSVEQMEQVRVWRNQVPETLRTPYPLTAEMQEHYYKTIICERQSTTRYFGLWETVTMQLQVGSHDTCPKDKDMFVGYGGVENISWETRNGEISLLIRPGYRGNGYGKAAVKIILDHAFCVLNLDTVYGECYKSGPWGFWDKLCKESNTYVTILPRRKFWEGRYWDSIYFSFNRTSQNTQYSSTEPYSTISRGDYVTSYPG